MSGVKVDEIKQSPFDNWQEFPLLIEETFVCRKQVKHSEED